MVVGSTRYSVSGGEVPVRAASMSFVDELMEYEELQLISMDADEADPTRTAARAPFPANPPPPARAPEPPIGEPLLRPSTHASATKSALAADMPEKLSTAADARKAASRKAMRKRSKSTRHVANAVLDQQSTYSALDEEITGLFQKLDANQSGGSDPGTLGSHMHKLCRPTHPSRSTS